MKNKIGNTRIWHLESQLPSRIAIFHMPFETPGEARETLASAAAPRRPCAAGRGPEFETHLRALGGSEGHEEGGNLLSCLNLGSSAFLSASRAPLDRAAVLLPFVVRLQRQDFLRHSRARP